MPRCIVEHVPTDDRRLVLLEMDGAPTESGLPDVQDAIVRVRVRCDEQQAQAWQAAGPRLVEQLRERGAHRVIGPLMQVERHRRVRSDLTVDVSPERALEAWLAQQEIEGEAADAVRREAKEIMHG